MQNKKSQQVLFTKSNTAKNREKVSKLLKKYPFSLNLRYKELELNSLYKEKLNASGLKGISNYAIDKQYIKMKLKRLVEKEGTGKLNISSDRAETHSNNLPKEAGLANLTDNQEMEGLRTNLNTDKPVTNDINEQNITMAAKKKDSKLADENQDVPHFTDWLGGLKKPKKKNIETEESDIKSKKKKKKKQKSLKKQAKNKESELEQAEIISETLAELMAKQGYTEKAIEMYNRLSLLFPEKNSYFAAKIEDLNN